MPNLNGVIEGYKAMGLQAPSSERAGDNTTWYGVTSRGQNDAMYYCVYQTDVNGANPKLRWFGPPAMHRCTMKQEVDGRLIVTGYVGSGDGSQTTRVAIPGYAPRLPQNTSDHRIEALEAKMTELKAQLQNALGIDQYDRLALDKLRAMLGL